MKLAVQIRDLKGKEAKHLRKDGKVPCVIYGKNVGETISVLVDKTQLVKTYKEAGRSTPVELTGEDGLDHLALFHDIQLDPVTDNLIHVDFLAVSKDEKVEAEVPVELIGKSELAKKKLGHVQLLKQFVNVEALPLDLPPKIEIDISGITEIGEVIFIKDVDLGDKIEIVDDLDIPLASAVEFTEEEEEEDELAETLLGEEGQPLTEEEIEELSEEEREALEEQQEELAEEAEGEEGEGEEGAGESESEGEPQQ